MKWFAIPFVLILITCFICIGFIFAGFYWWERENLNYVERITNISYPDGISDVDFYDNGEFYVIVHTRLKRENITTFIDGHNLQPVSMEEVPKTTDDWDTWSKNRLAYELEIWTPMLLSKNRSLPKDADLVFVQGCTESNKWLHVLDQKSGRLWSVVFYPDWSGDSPGCW